VTGAPGVQPWPDAESGSPGAMLGWSSTSAPSAGGVDEPSVSTVDGGLSVLLGGGVVVDGVTGFLLGSGRVMGGADDPGFGGGVTGTDGVTGSDVTGVVGGAGTVKTALAVNFVQFPIGTLALTVYLPGLAFAGTVAPTEPVWFGPGGDWANLVPAQKNSMYRQAGRKSDQEMVNALPAGPVLGFNEIAGFGGGWDDDCACANGAVRRKSTAPQMIRTNVRIVTSIAVTPEEGLATL
jgi:hypothetical protein